MSAFSWCDRCRQWRFNGHAHGRPSRSAPEHPGAQEPTEAADRAPREPAASDLPPEVAVGSQLPLSL